MKRWLVGLGIILILVGIIFLSESQKSRSVIVDEIVGDIWGKESREDYVITGYFENKSIILLSLWAGGDWIEDPVEAGDDFHDYAHVDAFVCIFDPEGKNITLDIPFALVDTSFWVDPNGIFSRFSNSIYWYNGTNFGVITKSGNYTVKYLGEYPFRRSPISRLLVKRKMLQTGSESGDSLNNLLLFSGSSLIIIGTYVFFIGLIKGRKSMLKRKTGFDRLKIHPRSNLKSVTQKLI